MKKLLVILVLGLLFFNINNVIAAERIISGTRQQAKGKSVAMISNIRDEFLFELQKLRKKFEKKIR